MRQFRLPLASDIVPQPSHPLHSANTELDCIVVGHNDIDFDQYVTAQKSQSRIAGAYFDAKVNSVRFNGKRITYMGLLNHVLSLALGEREPLSAFEVPHLGAYHLASYLRKQGLQVEIVNHFNQDREKFISLLQQKPNAVAITTTYYVDPMPIIDLVKFIRQYNKDTKIILGGPYIHNLFTDHNIATQESLLQLIRGDVYINDGQGLKSLTAILYSLRAGDISGWEQIPNLVFSLDNKTFVRAPREIEDYDLNQHPVDWSLFQGSVFSLPVYMRTAMSCPFSCSFCNFPAMGGEHRLADIEIVERELMQLKAAGVKYMVFIDDTFNVPLPRFKRLLQMMIKNRFDFKWLSFFRCSNADEETFDLMRESGCIAVFLGIESGDQAVLNNMKKFARIDKYIEGVAKLKERGILTNASFIVGFPGETRETVRNTIRFIDEAAPTFYNLQLYYHDVRTPIHRDAEKFNIRGAGYSWSHATMNWQEAAGWMEFIHKSVKHSLPLTTYGFSIWSLPYLLSKGITVEQFHGFAKIAREMLVRSLDDIGVDFTSQVNRMVALLQNTPLGQRTDARTAEAAIATAV